MAQERNDERAEAVPLTDAREDQRFMRLHGAAGAFELSGAVTGLIAQVTERRDHGFPFFPVVAGPSRV